MDPRPFVRLPTPRAVDRPDLPPDLVGFYAWHEGAGPDDPDGDRGLYRIIRLCELAEVARIGWEGLGLATDTPEGWERFSAFRLGTGSFFSQIVYAVSAPICPPGAILAIGGGVVELPTVLGATFPDWLAHLERCGWAEPMIESYRDFTAEERAELYRYYRALNPDMDLGEA
jgi:hypothetical protein